MTITNCTITGHVFTGSVDWADDGTDVDEVNLQGRVKLTPVTADKKPFLAPGHTPPAVVASQFSFTGLVVDGEVQDFRVWANDPVFGLDRLLYRVEWDVATPAGRKVPIEGGYFEAPSTDTTVDLSDVLTSTGSPISGVVREQGYAEDIIDAQDYAKDFLRDAANAATARALLGVDLTDLDEWEWYDTLAGFPATGSTLLVYGARDTGFFYRWNGSAYVKVSNNVAAAEITDSGATGRAVVQADTQAVARKALGPQVFDARDYGVVADLPVAATTATDTISATGHGLSNGNRVYFHDIGSATGINLIANYYVVSATTNTFKVSATAGGSAISLGTASVKFCKYAPHANVANMRDCLAACARAGGGRVLVPSGVIDTSDTAPPYGTKNSGVITSSAENTYINRGGIPIPAGVPIEIVGNDTVFRLSPGLTRLWDFEYVADGQLYRDVTVRGIVADLCNMTGEALGSGTFTAATVIPKNTWTAVPINVTTPFDNAVGGFIEGYNASPSTINIRVNSGAVEVYLSTSADTVSVAEGAKLTGALGDQHTFLGNRYLYNLSPYNMRWENLSVVDCKVRNAVCRLPKTSGMTLSDFIADRPAGILLVPLSRSGSMTDSYAVGVTIKNFDAKGCQGVLLLGNSWIDNVDIDGLDTDTNVVPCGNWASNNVMIGGSSRVGTVAIRNSRGRRSGDPAVELNQVWHAIDDNNVWEDCNIVMWARNVKPPCATIAGPPTGTLGTTMANNTTSVTITIDPAPTSVDESGFIQIGTELLWYQRLTSTSFKVWRGVNGSTTASHASPDTVTWVETHKQRLITSRGLHRFSEAQTAAGKAASYGLLGDNQLPATSLTIRELNIETYGGEATAAKFLDFGTYVADIDIQGVLSVRTPTITTNGNTYGPIMFSAGQVASDYLAGAPIPPTRLYGRNNRFVIHANGSGTTSIAVLRPYNGYILLDWEMEADLAFRGASGNQITAAYLAGDGVRPLILAGGSRLALRGIHPESGSVSCPIGVLIGNSSTLTIAKDFRLTLNMSQWGHAYHPADNQYAPLLFSSGDTVNVPKVVVERIWHSPNAARSYPNGFIGALTADGPFIPRLVTDNKDGTVTLA